MKDLTKAELTEHERRIAEFMTEARAIDPKRVSLIESKYPVLTNRQMQRRQKVGSSLDVVPVATNAQGAYMGQLPRPYSKRSNENHRHPHPAD